MMRAVVALALLGGALQLVACSSPSPTPAAPPAPSSASSSATPAAPAPTPSTALTTSTTSVVVSATVTALAGGAYPAAEVCSYLEGRVPVLKGIGSPVGAHANLVGNLFGFFQSHAIAADSVALDEATTTTCPAVREQLLSIVGVKSFTEL